MTYCTLCGKENKNTHSSICSECQKNLRRFGTTNKDLIKSGNVTLLYLLWILSVLILAAEIIFFSVPVILGAGEVFGIVIAVASAAATFRDGRKLNAIGRTKVPRTVIWTVLAFVFAPVTVLVYSLRTRRRAIREIASTYDKLYATPVSEPAENVTQIPKPSQTSEASNRLSQQISDFIVSIALEPDIVEASVGEVFDIRILIFSNQEIQSGSFNVETSAGLAVLEYPKPAGTIPSSEEGFLERIKVKALSFGNQSIKLILRGKGPRGNFEKPAQVAIRVKAFAPELGIAVKDCPNRVPLGAQFVVVLHLANTGKGAARSFELLGADSLLPQLKITQSFPLDAIVGSGSSLDQPIMCQACKSGDVSMNGVLLRYEDMNGNFHSKELSMVGIRIEIFTPQPQFGLLISYNIAGLPKGEVHVSYMLTNSSSVNATQFHMKVVLAEGVLLNRGALSSIKSTFQGAQIERGDFYLRFDPSGNIATLIDHFEIQYADSELVLRTVKLAADQVSGSVLKGIQSDVQVQPILKETSVAASANSEPVEMVTTSALRSSSGTAPSQFSALSDSAYSGKAKMSCSSLLEKGSTDEWLQLLDGESNQEKIDLVNAMTDDAMYRSVGYRNLVLAIFDSGLSRKEIDRRISLDKFTERCAEFLLTLKSNGYVEYASLSSDVQYADEILRILSPGNSSRMTASSESSSAKKHPSAKSKETSFTDAHEKAILVSRRVMMGQQSKRPDAVRFEIIPQNGH